MAGRPRTEKAPPDGRRGGRRPFRPVAVGLCLALVGLPSTACDGGEVRSGSADSMTYETLVERLAETGTDVWAADGSIPQPWSDVPGRRLEVAGETVQVFEYSSPNDAAQQADRISPDGTTIGPHRVEWVEPARFYRIGRLIVLYVGSAPTVREALEAVLDAPFAGPATR